jgi:hypothetical protein
MDGYSAVTKIDMERWDDIITPRLGSEHPGADSPGKTFCCRLMDDVNHD